MTSNKKRLDEFNHSGGVNLCGLFDIVIVLPDRLDCMFLFLISLNYNVWPTN